MSDTNSMLPENTTILDNQTSNYMAQTTDYINQTADFLNQTTYFPNQTTTAKGPSIVDQLMTHTEYRAAVYINNYYLYLLNGIGIPGSVCALITICNMKPLTSSSLYMAVLSVVDALSLIFKLLYLLLTLYDIRMYDIGCKSLFFIGTYLMHYSNWLLVSMTIERFIAIWFPLRVTKLCTKRRACLNMVLVGVLLVVVNFQFFITAKEDSHNVYVWVCTFHDQYLEFSAKVWYWIDGAVYSIIPFVLLIIFNTLIICGIKMASSKQKMLTNKIDKTKGTDKVKHQQQITVMLISISVVFVILTVPNCCLFILKNYWNFKKDIHTYATYFLVVNVIFFLSDLNHAINFYLYFLSGRKFRRMFINSICCCRRKPLRRPYSTTMSQISSTSMRATGSVYNGRSSMVVSPQNGILKNGTNDSACSSQTTINTIS